MKLNSKNIQKAAIGTLLNGAGGLGAAALNMLAPPSVSPKIVGIAKLFLCAATKGFVNEKKFGWAHDLASGGAGVAMLETSHAFGFTKFTIAGIGEVGAHQIDEDYMDSPLNGLDDATVNGDENPVH